MLYYAKISGKYIVFGKWNEITVAYMATLLLKTLLGATICFILCILVFILVINTVSRVWLLFRRFYNFKIIYNYCMPRKRYPLM